MTYVVLMVTFVPGVVNSVFIAIQASLYHCRSFETNIDIYAPREESRTFETTFEIVFRAEEDGKHADWDILLFSLV